MNTKTERERIGGVDVARPKGPAALARARSIAGARVYDVGQGDAIAVIDEAGQTLLQLDYGGRQGNPFGGKSPVAVDGMLPVPKDALVMVTHWDEDHWSTAPRGEAAKASEWLVPRQVTSPRATRFAADLENVHCIPEDMVGNIFKFQAMNGDAVLWQKIAQSSPSPLVHENCNKTGVAIAVLRRSGDRDQVILLPGDAPFDQIPLFVDLYRAGTTLTGLVAFHHGSKYHWTTETRSMLRNWPITPGGPCEVVFSYGAGNSYGHPHPHLYRLIANWKAVETPTLRAANAPYHDIMFR